MVVGCCVLACTASARLSAAAVDPDPQRFAAEVDAFVAYDRKNTPLRGATLFVGSSSIRLWDTASAFPELTVVNRGFGGSQTSDLNYFYEQLVAPFAPATIILYEGDNDISDGKSPEQVYDDFLAFALRVREELPNTRILFLSIKPSKARWPLWPQMQRANALVRQFAGTDPRVTFVDVGAVLLDAAGQPKDVYVEDGLHLNSEGYRLWTTVLRPYLR